MAIAPDIIAQHTPAAGGAFEAAYTVPASTQVTVSTIIIHNTDPSVTDDGRVRVANNGAANAATQQIINVNIPPDGSAIITTGVTISATDVLRVASTNGTLNFHFYGIVET
jgi:hypothetical protein